ncbi:MAG: right-handed parallel beta-helix repeat-containing protein [Candidatus Cloacimonetes bacterium]|nr:right-handed parallel beta-helix repeat-containing protein [Candidatus Cloacimonadota bacterium]
MRKLLSFVILFALASLWSIVIPAGNVSGNWTLADSPYFIDGDITVDSESTLDIAAGVEVLFNDLYSLAVNGRLIAIGTEADSILVSRSDGGLGWQGIRFINCTDNGLEDSSLQYCRIERSTAIGGGTLANGGGIYCDNSNNVVLDHCYFYQNYAAWDGGGVYLGNASDINITNCSFVGNSCGFYGAGMIVYGSAPVIDRCEFRQNNAAVFAGGLSAWTGANVTITNCRFQYNTAGACCGIYGVSSTFNLANLIFIHNDTDYGAGAAIGLTSCTTEASNLSIIDNISPMNGGAFWVNGGTLSLYNSILWGNMPNQIALENGSSGTVANCCIQEGFEGENIISDDPGLFDIADYDLHLMEDSPCIDAGDASLVTFTLPETDFDGLMRIMDGDGDGDAMIDLGVYEYELIIIYEPPAHVTVDWATGLITWEAPLMEELTGFKLYLDGVLVAEVEPDIEEYQFTDLLEGTTYVYGIIAVYEGGESDIVEVEFIYMPSDTDENEISIIQLMGNYPNPFNPETNIRFSITETAVVRLTVYNLQGKRVKTLLNGMLTAASHNVIWDGRNESGENVSSGVYIYQLQTPQQNLSSRMILLK